MASRAWIFQQARDRQQMGADAPWYVGWYVGRRKRSLKLGSKSLAEKYRRKREGELAAGILGPTRKTWQDFRKEYEAEILPKVRPGTRMQIKIGLAHFERLVKPSQLASVGKADIDRYAVARLAEEHHGHLIRPPTVNKELRALRAFLREAEARKYLAEVPRIAFLKEAGKVPTYISPEVFASLYGACDAAQAPADQGYSAADWCRAYLMFLYLTGWRCMEPLSLTKEDVDWDRGIVHLRAENNKGNRAELVPLHALVVEHLRAIRSFGPHLLPWPLPRRRLWDEFHRIQEKAGIGRRADGEWFGFHDLRRGFATMNADRMSADALQTIMRHRDHGTTQRYVNMARQLNPAVANLFIPDLPTRKGVQNG